MSNSRTSNYKLIEMVLKQFKHEINNGYYSKLRDSEIESLATSILIAVNIEGFVDTFDKSRNDDLNKAVDAIKFLLEGLDSYMTREQQLTYFSRSIPNAEKVVAELSSK